MLVVVAASSFSRAIKKLHPKDKLLIDQAVKAIVSEPLIGDEKKGDLAGVFVHKFKLNKQELLLAYQLMPTKYSPESLVLLSLGSHENFYAALKRRD